jgi:hypothetical protein
MRRPISARRAAFVAFVSGATMATVFAVPATPAQSGQDVSLDALLASAGAYVGRYFETMSDVVAEERYTQEIGTASGTLRVARDPFAPNPDRIRRLRSDVIVLRIGPPLEWRAFRDVFEVDDKPVRDRDDRLAKLFLEPAASATAQARRIAEESTRYNLGSLGRTLNEPGLSLAFLQPALQARFAFGVEKQDGNDIWVVRFEEKRRPTVFRHNGTLDNPSAGRFWIDRRTGAVSRSEFRVAPGPVVATFVTRYKLDDRFGVSVPTDLSDDYVLNRAVRFFGSATYSNYRRFAVTTDTATTPPERPR